MKRLLVLGFLVGLSGCILSPLDLGGKRCSTPNDCGASGQCVSSVCVSGLEIQFTNVPVELSVESVSSDLRVGWVTVDGGTPPGTPDETLQFTSDSPTGQFSLTGDSGGTWATTLSTTLRGASGSLASAFYRDTSPGVHHVQAQSSSGASASQPVKVLPSTFADDAESGTLTTGDSPRGAWSAALPGPTGASPRAAAAAAHRGGFGIEVTDTSTSLVTGIEATVRHPIPAPTYGPASNYFLRMWFRETGSGSSGSVSYVQVGNGPNDTPLVELKSNFDHQTFGIAGFDGAGGYLESMVPAPPMDGTWHLVELSLENLGTAHGVRRFWMDGALVAATSVPIAWDSATVRLQLLSLGEPWGSAETFSGTVDFDDVRTSPAPPASRFLWQPGSTPLARAQCGALQVTLVDSSGAPAPAPYAVAVNLAASGAPVAYFSNPGCTVAVQQVSIPLGATGATVFALPAQSGSATLVASHPDFLTGSLGVQVP